jgi:3,4-dihydroxy 2-butanone 4-phosphate synthase/GTP cyclohydrolase II
MLLSIADVITWRLAHERLVHRVGETVLVRPPFGEFMAVAYASDVDPMVHLALVKGEVAGEAPVLTRVHRATLLGDLLDTCTGTGSLRTAFERIAREGQGVLLILQKHVGGADALSLSPASNMQPIPGGHGEARLREFGIGAQILADLGVKKLRMMTNTAGPILGVERYGLQVVEQLPLAEQAEAPPAAPARRRRRR